jgi:hypothetical protein
MRQWPKGSGTALRRRAPLIYLADGVGFRNIKKRQVLYTIRSRLVGIVGRRPPGRVRAQ